tara:strand:+ start:5227 stop:5976 length:750 start_codon:yes stop_codon:yes gene_type:complete
VHCYNSDYCQDCQNCIDSQYCKDCFGCKNCFGCAGLYQKQYRFFNEQLTKEEYEKRILELDLCNPDHRAAVQQRVEELRKTIPQIATHQYQTEDCSGDHISESKDCHQCYDIFASEECLYTIEANANTSCSDLTVCFETEASYSCVQSPLCFGSNFLFHMDSTHMSEFCAYGRNLKNCFGCVYMENKEYHILNKPYSPEDYEKEVAKIKKELMDAGKYNMGLYLVSDYEKKRLENETDSVIQSNPPVLK